MKIYVQINFFIKKNIIDKSLINKVSEFDNKKNLIFFAKKLVMSIDNWLEQAWACKPITESAVRQLCNMVKSVLA